MHASSNGKLAGVELKWRSHPSLTLLGALFSLAFCGSVITINLACLDLDLGLDLFRSLLAWMRKRDELREV